MLIFLKSSAHFIFFFFGIFLHAVSKEQRFNVHNVELENENFNKCTVRMSLINYEQDTKFKIYGTVRLYIFAIQS